MNGKSNLLDIFLELRTVILLSPVTYKHGSAEPRDVGKHRVSRPRQHWTFKSKELIYNKFGQTDYSMKGMIPK